MTIPTSPPVQQFSEDRRQLEHLAPVAFAFLLPFIPYWLAIVLSLLAIVYAVYVSPSWIRFTTRAEEIKRRLLGGKLYYALAVLCLLIVFRNRIYIAAAVWAILGVGDSLSNILGRRIRSARFFYNPHKTVAGSLTFWLTGGLAAWILLMWNLPAGHVDSAAKLFFFSLIASLFCALGESLPTIIDDNLVIGWIGGMTYALLFSIGDGSPNAASPWVESIAVNLLAAVMAISLKWLSLRGALLAFLFGLVIYSATGLPGYVIIATFLVAGSLATQVGFTRKERLHVDQPHRGTRGLANVLANGLVAFILAAFFFWMDETWLRIAYTAAIAAAAFDTVSTEIGQWLGLRPVNPLTFRRVPIGTQGAISLEGTLAGMAAALLISTLPAVLGWLAGVSIAFIFLGAVAGGVFESVIGSLFVYDFDYVGEVLNLYNTAFGASVAAVLWSSVIGH